MAKEITVKILIDDEADEQYFKLALHGLWTGDGLIDEEYVLDHVRGLAEFPT